MNNIPILSNPDIQNQLWALVAVGISWLIGKAVSWVRGQLSDSQKDLLGRVENYAREAAAWAIVHFPGLDVPSLAAKGEDKLRAILKTQGINIPDVIWSHLTQVVEGYIVQQLTARHTSVAPVIPTARGVSDNGGVVSGNLPKGTP